MTDKAALKAQLLALVSEALAAAHAAHAAAVEGATHAEAQAENDKDTRGLEQSYLARGQAQRVAELEVAAAALAAFAVRAFATADPVAVGALVDVEEHGAVRRYFLAPDGGGSELVGGIHVITPRSPLGAALHGKRVDDEVEVTISSKLRTLAVVAIE